MAAIYYRDKIAIQDVAKGEVTSGADYINVNNGVFEGKEVGTVMLYYEGRHLYDIGYYIVLFWKRNPCLS